MAMRKKRVPQKTRVKGARTTYAKKFNRAGLKKLKRR